MLSPLQEPGLLNIWELAFSTICLYTFWIAYSSWAQRSKYPLVGTQSKLEAAVVSNFRFYRTAQSILLDGYSKYKERIFQFTRADCQMLVLPAKYVNELRMLPSTIASPTIAHAHNLMGRYTNMNIILQNNLHFRTIQTKMTPNLNSLTAPMQEELDLALEKELPSEAKDHWITIHPYHTILRLVARISARVFLGLPHCRNNEWLEVSTQFTENVFVSLVVLRLFPMWMHCALSWILPSFYRGHAYIRRAQRLLVPEIERRREAKAKGQQPTNDNNLLSWMMEIATDQESDANELAHLEVVISLASIHTSQMNAVHCIYDMVERPEYIEPIREEIRQVIEEDGPWLQWTKSSFTKLKHLDSFMKESQRFNPPSLLAMHRVVQQNHYLSDGTKLEKGAHISVPVNAIQNDPQVTPNPTMFDGDRYYKLRQREGESHLHQFSTTNERLLNFGHGMYSCPGRFFASLEIKVILVRLIMDYEFRFLEGQGRPENLHAHEFIFPNPDGELQIRARPDSEKLQL